ncbi:beta-galactosidase, partial [Acinetobacter baumannii]
MSLRLGVCYYPEHWPEAMWESDAQRMKALGIKQVRIGE